MWARWIQARANRTDVSGRSDQRDLAGRVQGYIWPALLQRDRLAMTDQPWHMSHRADPAAKRLADRHYNRQKPNSPQFVPPGSCLVEAMVNFAGRNATEARKYHLRERGLD